MEQDIYKVISDLVHYLSYSRELSAEEKDMAVKATTNKLSKKILAEFALQDKIYCLAVDNAVPTDTGILIFEEFNKLLKRREESKIKIKDMTN